MRDISEVAPDIEAFLTTDVSVVSVCARSIYPDTVVQIKHYLPNESGILGLVSMGEGVSLSEVSQFLKDRGFREDAKQLLINSGVTSYYFSRAIDVQV